MDELAAVGVRRGAPLAVAVVPRQGLALAWHGGSRQVPAQEPTEVVRALTALEPRWVWWSARQTAAPLLDAGVRPATCWDLAAVARLLDGTRRDDPATVWAAARQLPEPEPLRELDLLDLPREDGGPVHADGQLSREWAGGAWVRSLGTAECWAQLALDARSAQHRRLLALPDSRPAPRGLALPLATAHAESAAALLAVELEQEGLPVDRDAAAALLGSAVGPRPVDEAHAAALRAQRDETVRRHFPGTDADLRNPAQVRALLRGLGLELPDTRSWRLRPHADLPGVAALLDWRRKERIATTYGWGWLDAHVGPDGRLRGRWSAADAAAGRMTAGSGLHNLPADLRAAVRAEPDHVLVRADLGQIEPRVLAAVSGDPALAAAAAASDMYAPVAAHLRCERSTAKVAVLAAMYGQTTGAAGAALADMRRAYPRAMAYLAVAEQAGREGRPVRTYGGRLLAAHVRSQDWDLRARGRYVRNAMVQGAAAELFKAWTATVRAALVTAGGRIVLCLHDELLVHVPRDGEQQVRDVLDRSLQSTASWWAAGSRVRFVVEVGAGESWVAAR